MVKMLSVAAGIALLSLAACSGPTLTLSRSSHGIALRWWGDELADSQAQQIAAGYCTRFGKSVALRSIEDDGSASIGRYRCV